MCWNVDNTNDWDHLTKNGAQNQAILAMINKLIEAKDSSVDLANMSNEMYADYVAAAAKEKDDGGAALDKVVMEPLENGGDFGLILSRNLASAYRNFKLADLFGD